MPYDNPIYNDPIWQVCAFVIGAALIVVSWLFFSRAWDVVNSASRFSQVASRKAGSTNGYELVGMNRKERFHALPAIPKLPWEFTLQRYHHESSEEPAIVLDRFERLLLGRAPVEASFGILHLTDPRRRSIAIILWPPSQAVQLLGWLEFTPAFQGFDWRLMVSEVRRFKSPQFEESHFSQSPDFTSSGSDSYDVAKVVTAVAFSGYRTRHGYEAAEHLKVLLQTCLAEALVPGPALRSTSNAQGASEVQPKTKRRRE